MRGVALADGTRDHAPDRRVGLQSARHLPALADATRRRRPTICVRRWSAIPHDDGYESKIDAVLDRCARRSCAATGSLGADAPPIAPVLAEIDRGHRSCCAGPRCSNGPGCSSTCRPCSIRRWLPPGRHVLSLEVLYTPYGLRGGWTGVAEPRRWLELFAELCEPGFLDSIVDWRAMTPDVYEREFHLPAGHATSFAGGPLAAFRNTNPELTKYETAVAGLYLTGAATFPGAGVWGASGRNCATVILEQRG